MRKFAQSVDLQKFTANPSTGGGNLEAPRLLRRVYFRRTGAAFPGRFLPHNFLGKRKPRKLLIYMA
jgi:hypothetical protein